MPTLWRVLLHYSFEFSWTTITVLILPVPSVFGFKNSVLFHKMKVSLQLRPSQPSIRVRVTRLRATCLVHRLRWGKYIEQPHGEMPLWTICFSTPDLSWTRLGKTSFVERISACRSYQLISNCIQAVSKLKLVGVLWIYPLPFQGIDV